MNTNVHRGTALVTGASSGIGAIYADRLARRGYDLILVARNTERLHTLATTLTDQTGRLVETLAADLTDRGDLARVAKVLRTDASLTLLLNNAGVGATAPLLQSDLAGMDAMVALNVTAPLHLTHAVAPAFVARGAGTIINMSSITAIAPELLNGVYGGSKAFVLAFSQSLHHELGAKGIRVQAVLPGATATGFWDAAGTPLAQLPEGIVMFAADMVDAALSGLDQGELVTIPSLPAAADWNAYEAARTALGPNLSRASPAQRYAH